MRCECKKNCETLLKIFTYEEDISTYGTSDLTKEQVELCMMNKNGSNHIIVNKKELMEQLK